MIWFYNLDQSKTNLKDTILKRLEDFLNKFHTTSFQSKNAFLNVMCSFISYYDFAVKHQTFIKQILKEKLQNFYFKLIILYALDIKTVKKNKNLYHSFIDEILNNNFDLVPKMANNDMYIQEYCKFFLRTAELDYFHSNFFSKFSKVY